MKKLLLSLAVALSGCFGASALNHLPLATNPNFTFVLIPQDAAAVTFKAPSRADEKEDSMQYNIAGAPYAPLGFKNVSAGDRFACAVEMTADDATRFAGNQLTEISFYTGVRNSTTSTTQMNYITEYTVFICNDLQGERIVEQKITGVTRVAFKQVTVPLESPLTIEAGKSYYIGMEFAIKNANDMPIVIDGLDHGNNIDGGWYAIYDKTTEKYSWDNFAESFGFNCISATLKGESLPKNGANVVTIGAPSTSYTDTPFTVQAIVTNNASNPLSSLEFTVTVGDNAPVSETFATDTPLNYGEECIVGIENLTYATPGKTTIKAEVTKVNGVANTTVNNAEEQEVTFYAPGTAFETMVVAEEFTGIRCGYCPSGIVNMDAMKEKYPDSFILVAVHVNIPSTDPMYNSSFSRLVNDYCTAAPSSIMNRMCAPTPTEFADLEYYYTEIHDNVLALGKVEATGSLSEDKKTLTVNTSTTFGVDTDNSKGNYRLSYVITEDNVGPYNQTNYYSGGQLGDCGGWEKLGSSVSTIYNDVARYMDGYPGVAGSLPAELTGLQPVTGSRDITIPTNVTNVENINLVVYLVDSTTKVIVNACKVKSGEIAGNSAISDVTVDNSDAPVEYFNLQGVRVENPSNGLYIRRQGTDVKKIIL